VADLRAQDCRERALECTRKAQQATEPSARSTFADLAKQWLEMAADLEHLERRRRYRLKEDYGR
jgi:hypothetical protein